MEERKGEGVREEAYSRRRPGDWEGGGRCVKDSREHAHLAAPRAAPPWPTQAARPVHTCQAVPATRRTREPRLCAATPPTSSVWTPPTCGSVGRLYTSRGLRTCKRGRTGYRGKREGGGRSMSTRTTGKHAGTTTAQQGATKPATLQTAKAQRRYRSDCCLCVPTFLTCASCVHFRSVLKRPAGRNASTVINTTSVTVS